MIRTLATATLLTLALGTSAYAMDPMKCDDDSMMKMQTEMDAMTDPMMKDQKEMAMKEMDMAKTAMGAGKTDDCTMHMDNAMKEMMKKS